MYTLSEARLGERCSLSTVSPATRLMPVLSHRLYPASSVTPLPAQIGSFSARRAHYVDSAGTSAAAFDRTRATIDGFASKSTVT